jgi:hypothetical protein
MWYDKIKSFFFTFIIALLFGVFIGWVSVATGYERRLRDSDRELGELRKLNTQLESDYRGITDRTAELTNLLERRREIDRRAIEQTEGIGETIGRLSLQGQSALQQVRTVISLVQDIKVRTKLLEDILRSNWDSIDTRDSTVRMGVEDELE